jgi:hypothetical protein
MIIETWRDYLAWQVEAFWERRQSNQVTLLGRIWRLFYPLYKRVVYPELFVKDPIACGYPVSSKTFYLSTSKRLVPLVKNLQPLKLSATC